MNWKKIIGIIALIAIVAIVFLKLKSNKQITENRVYQIDKEKPIAVGVDTIKLQNINDQVIYSGSFEPNRETKVSAETQGKVNSVLVDVGSHVNKGQTLIHLDNSLLKLQLQSVDVQIEGLQVDVNRYTILTKADAIQGVQLEKAQLGLKAANVQRATLLEQINKTTIKAPFSGIVTAKLTEEGAYAAPGIPLIQITDIASLRFTINVPEKELIHFQLNQQYTISADANADISLLGKVLMIGSKANMGSSFPIQFNVNNTKNLAIKSGMFGKVSTIENNVDQGIIIPSSSIVEEAGQARVYIVKNGKAIFQSINISKIVGNKTVVSSGLEVGDVLVINGFINLFEGANVESNTNGQLRVTK